MPWYATVYDLLLQVSLAGFVLLAAGWIAMLAVREPARRIRVVQWTLLGLLALPLLALMPGYPRVAILPAPGDRRPDMGNHVPAVADEEQSRSQPMVQLPVMPNRSPTDAPPAPEIDRRERAVESAQPTLDPVAAPSSEPRGTAREVIGALAMPRDHRFYVVLAYLAGVAAMLGWSLVSLMAMRRLVASARPADARTREMLRDAAGAAGDGVRLLISPRAAQPCAFGIWRPTIVLPETLLGAVHEKEIRFSLAHEWSHIERRDLATWLLASLARSVYFHQPFLWLIRSKLRLAQDYLADAAAAGTATPEDYAEFLTAISRHPGPVRLMPGLGIAGRRSNLHRRVVMLVEKQGSLERIAPRRWNLIVATGVVAAVGLVATLRAEPRTDDPPGPETPGLKREQRPSPQATSPRGVPPSNTLEAYDEWPAGSELRDNPIAPDSGNRPGRDATGRTSPPFSGRIRPGDILDIDIEGGFPNADVPPRTVEPEGTVALVARYGSQRFHVAGKTLAEAGELIEEHLRKIARDPAVLVTYAGHDPDVVAADHQVPTQAKAIEPTQAKPIEQPQSAPRRKLRPGMPTPSMAPTPTEIESPDRIERLEREIKELKEMIRELKAPPENESSRKESQEPPTEFRVVRPLPTTLVTPSKDPVPTLPPFPDASEANPK